MQSWGSSKHLILPIFGHFEGRGSTQTLIGSAVLGASWVPSGRVGVVDLAVRLCFFWKTILGTSPCCFALLGTWIVARPKQLGTIVAYLVFYAPVRIVNRVCRIRDAAF